MSMDSSISGTGALDNFASALALADITVSIKPTGKLVDWSMYSEPFELRIGNFTKPNGTKMVLEEHVAGEELGDDWYTMCIGVAVYAEGERPELPGDDRTITKEEYEAQQKAEAREYDNWYNNLSPEERAEVDEREAERERQFEAYGSYYADRKTVVAPDGTILDQLWLDWAKNLSDEEFRLRMEEEVLGGGRQQLHLAAKMIGRTVL